MGMGLSPTAKALNEIILCIHVKEPLHLRHRIICRVDFRYDDTVGIRTTQYSRDSSQVNVHETKRINVTITIKIHGKQMFRNKLMELMDTFGVFEWKMNALRKATKMINWSSEN